MQYIVSGALSLAVGFYTLYKGRGIAAKFFMLFTTFLFLWQFLVFLHRNAPGASLSKALFISSNFFIPLALLSLLFSILSLQHIIIKRKYMIILLCFVFLVTVSVIYAPVEVLWTEYGWSYKFGYEITSITLALLTFSYVAINFFWIRKIVRESKSIILKAKYKSILAGFAMIFVVSIIYNAFPLSLFPNTPPIGGISTSIGLLIISRGILLKEELQNRSPYIGYGKISAEISLFLQNILSLMREDVLGQQYFNFERYLKEVGIDKIVEYSDGKIAILRDLECPQLVKILDKTLEYIEKGDLPEETILELVSLWNKIYPLIETSTIELIKAHEQFLINRRIIHEIADGKLRSIFLPRGFSEEDLDRFSQHLNFMHKDLFGNPILLEIDPSEKYEEIIKAYVYETLANRENLVVFTRRGSRILKHLPKEQVHVFYLSSEVSNKRIISNHEVEMPFDLTYLLGEISLAAKDMCSLLIDNVTDLIYSMGFKRTYKFIRSAIEIVVSSRIPALFIITKAHSDRIRAAFENIFPIIVEIKGNAVIRKGSDEG